MSDLLRFTTSLILSFVVVYANCIGIGQFITWGALPFWLGEWDELARGLFLTVWVCVAIGVDLFSKDIAR